MADAGIAVEQALGAERLTPQNPVPRAPLPAEAVPVLPVKVDLEAFYQAELVRNKIEEEQNKNIWQRLEEASEKESRPGKPQESPEQQTRKLSLSDKLRRKTLLLEARLRGVSDLKQLEQLIDYFESVITTEDSQYVKVDKNISEGKRQLLLEKWRAKGWSRETIYESDNKKYNELRFSRQIPYSFRREHVRSLVKLVSSSNNSIELVKGLEKMGFRFSGYTLGSPEQMEKLGRFFNSPNAKEALLLASGISNWRWEWFSGQKQYGRPDVETGQIEFLTQIAKSPDPKSAFDPDFIKQIDTLSKALGIGVGVLDIQRFRTIIQNPDYLQFAALMAGWEGRGYERDRIDILSNIEALDHAGVLKPVVGLYRHGIAIENGSYYSSNNLSIRRLFDSYEAKSNPEKIQKETIAYLQQKLREPEIAEYMQNPKKQEFTRLYKSITGFPIAAENLKSIEILLGLDLSKSREAVYVLRLLQSVDAGVPDLKSLSGIVWNQAIMETFTNPAFANFVNVLQDKIGYKPRAQDFCDERSSPLGGLFNNNEIKEALLREGTIKVIKAFHPDGRLIFSKLDYYIRLGSNPDIPYLVNTLRGLGVSFNDYWCFPQANELESMTSPENFTKLRSPELKSLAEKLKEEFQWSISASGVVLLISLYSDQDLQNLLFNQENSDFIKTMRPGGLHLDEIKQMLNLDSQRRDLLVSLVREFNYYPAFAYGVEQQAAMLTNLIQNEDLRNKLFSDKSREVYAKLRKNFYYTIYAEDIEIVAKAPFDFPELILELKEKYKYSFNRNDLQSLLEFSEKKGEFEFVLAELVKHGYVFEVKDLPKITELLPYKDKAVSLLSEVRMLVSDYGFDPDHPENPREDYKFKIEDIPYLLALMPHTGNLSKAVSSLRSVFGKAYTFKIDQSSAIATVAENNLSRERLLEIKEIYLKHVQDKLNFSPDLIPAALFLEQNEASIARLESYGYMFHPAQLVFLRRLFESPDKERIFQTIDILRSYFNLSFDLHRASLYLNFSKVPDLAARIKEAADLVSKDEFANEQNLHLFALLEANGPLYAHTKTLTSDEYFNNVRDARLRLTRFTDGIFRGEIPQEAAAKVFALSVKATDLDRLALKLSIAAEIGNASGNKDWHSGLLKAASLQEADEVLTRIMVESALPVIYPDLRSEDLDAKENELMTLASKDKEFDDVLQICCRSVGIFGAKYKNKGSEFIILINAVRQALELNRERNPKEYLLKRAELSKHQFDRLFEGFSNDVRKRVTEGWLNLSSRRRMRISGSSVTVEEATLSRLNRIRDIVQTDLTVHIGSLFLAKIRELEESVKRGDANGLAAEQLAVYKKYLLTPDGQPRQDIPAVYRLVEKFVHSAQANLKKAETPKEEKAKLGKTIGIYQGIADTLKAIYRLGTISEKRFKSRRDYVKELDKDIVDLSASLKRLRILDPEKRSRDVNTGALEGEVLLDLGKLNETMQEEGVIGQTAVDTESTVSFRDLARAPEMTQSCQRLTEVTGFNQAAYSRLLDVSNEMIDVYEMRGGEKNRLARSFIEFSKAKIDGEDRSKLVILIDREYVNNQYQNFGTYFSSEMIAHMLDRIEAMPEVSLIFDARMIAATAEAQILLSKRGFKLRQVSGEYFINESNVKLAKYYDSLGGALGVNQPSNRRFSNFYLIEKDRSS